jgi:RNA recognition motif-containing protein
MNLYIGNLSYDATEENLQELFGEYGEIGSVKIIKDRNTGNSKGFAFVEYVEQNIGQSAIDALNGKEWLTRNLVVNEARAR